MWARFGQLLLRDLDPLDDRIFLQSHQNQSREKHLSSLGMPKLLEDRSSSETLQAEPVETKLTQLTV